MPPAIAISPPGAISPMTNLTAGLEWTGTRLYTSIQLFRDSFDSFIETQAVGDPSGVVVYTYGSLDDGVTEGTETETLPSCAAGGAWIRRMPG